jgi:hypothetical protein
VFLEVYPQVLGASILKRCYKCGEYKSRDEFCKDKRSSDGLNQKCRACRSSYHEEHRDTDNEKTRIRQNARRNTDDAYRVKVNEEARQYHAEHRESIRARKRKYYAEHRQQHLEYKRLNRERLAIAHKEYDQSDRGKQVRNTVSRNRLAHIRAANGSITADELAVIRAAQTDKKGRLICWRCGKPIKGTPHLDHWIPLDKGGAHSVGNLHFMHPFCNQSKGAKHPTEIGRLL